MDFQHKSMQEIKNAQTETGMLSSASQHCCVRFRDLLTLTAFLLRSQADIGYQMTD